MTLTETDRDSEGKLMVVRPRTKDGIEITIGMRLWHRDCGPSGIVTGFVDGGLCLLIESGPLSTNWHACRTYSTIAAALAHEKCV